MAKIFFVSALLMVLAIDMFLFFGQTAITSINPSASRFFNFSGTLLQSADAGGYVVNVSSVNGNIPSQNIITAGDNSNIFTDIFTVLRGFFMDTLGFKYVFGVLGAPVGYVKYLNLPVEFSYGIGALWFILTFFLLLMVLTGRG